MIIPFFNAFFITIFFCYFRDKGKILSKACERGIIISDLERDTGTIFVFLYKISILANVFVPLS